MIKIWGRNTSVNVQKVMWAVGELGLPHERIDVGGAFGKNREPPYLAMNPNGLVPTLDARAAFAYTDKAMLHLAGTLQTWPDAWPALPPPIGQSTASLPFVLNYAGAVDFSVFSRISSHRRAR